MKQKIMMSILLLVQGCIFFAEDFDSEQVTHSEEVIDQEQVTKLPGTVHFGGSTTTEIIQTGVTQNNTFITYVTSPDEVIIQAGPDASTRSLTNRSAHEELDIDTSEIKEDSSLDNDMSKIQISNIKRGFGAVFAGGLKIARYAVKLDRLQNKGNVTGTTGGLELTGLDDGDIGYGSSNDLVLYADKNVEIIGKQSIDIFAEQDSIAIRTGVTSIPLSIGDIGLTAGYNVKLKANNDITLESVNQIDMWGGRINIRSGALPTVIGIGDMFIHANQNITCKTNEGDINIEANSDSSGISGKVNIRSGTAIDATGTQGDIGLAANKNVIIRSENGDFDVQADTDSSHSGKINIKSGLPNNLATNKGEIAITAKEDLILSADPFGGSTGTNGKINIRAGSVVPSAVNKGDIGLTGTNDIILTAPNIKLQGIVSGITGTPPVDTLTSSNASAGSDAAGGDATVRAGVGDGTGTGGKGFLLGGVGGDNSGTGGAVCIAGGNGGTANGNGGDVIIDTGSGVGTGVAGKINIRSGTTLAPALSSGDLGLAASGNLNSISSAVTLVSFNGNATLEALDNDVLLIADKDSSSSGKVNIQSGTTTAVGTAAGDIGLSAAGGIKATGATANITGTSGDVIIESIDHDVDIAADKNGSSSIASVNIRSGTSIFGSSLSGDIGISAKNNVVVKTQDEDVVIDAAILNSTGKVNLRSGTVISATSSAGDIGLSAANKIVFKADEVVFDATTITGLPGVEADDATVGSDEDGTDAAVIGGAGDGIGSGGTVNVIGGAGGATGMGGTTTIAGGSGGSTSGDGGTVSITGGAATSGSGGTVNITGGMGGSTNAGGSTTITGGSGGSTSGDGGTVRVFGGVAPTSGVGGTALVIGGAGGSVSGDGGEVLVSGGNAITSGSGGAAIFVGGKGGSSSGDGGEVLVSGGNAATSGSGGVAVLVGGAGGTLSGSGGSSLLAGGAGSATSGNGGNSCIIGGTGGGTNGAGGDIKLIGGTGGADDGDGGDVLIKGGAKTGNGTNGGIWITTADTSVEVENVFGEFEVIVGQVIDSVPISDIATRSGISNNANISITTEELTFSPALSEGDIGLKASGKIRIETANKSESDAANIELKAGNSFNENDAGSIIITAGSVTSDEGDSGMVSITGGFGNNDGNGGAVNITGGGSTAGDAGDVIIKGGIAASGQHGNVTVTTGGATFTATILDGDIGLKASGTTFIEGNVDFNNATVSGLSGGGGSSDSITGTDATASSNNAGGNATATGGDGDGSGAGGKVVITGGTAGTTGVGGNVEITASNGGSTSGAGGDVIIKAGTATSGNDGNVTVTTGGATFTATILDGDIGLKASGTTFIEGNVDFNNATVSGLSGGGGSSDSITGTDATASSNNAGGNATATGGDGDGTGAGGKVVLTGGTAGTNGGAGGDIEIIASNGDDQDPTAGDGGNVIIKAGVGGSGSSADGARGDISISDQKTLVKLIAFLHNYMPTVFLSGTTPTLTDNGNGTYSGIGTFDSSGISTTTGSFDGGNLVLTYNSTEQRIDITGSGLVDETKSIYLGGSAVVIETSTSSDNVTFTWHASGVISIGIAAGSTSLDGITPTITAWGGNGTEPLSVGTFSSNVSTTNDFGDTGITLELTYDPMADTLQVTNPSSKFVNVAGGSYNNTAFSRGNTTTLYIDYAENGLSEGVDDQVIITFVANGEVEISVGGYISIP